MRRFVAVGVALALVMVSAPFAAALAAEARVPARGPVIGLVVAGSLTDTGYNALALEGVQRAAAALNGKVVTAEARSEGAYARAFNTVLRRGAAVVVSVGFPLDAATADAALANPSVQFFGVDQLTDTPPDNMQVLKYDWAQAGFLAGVVAGSVTASGIIGSVGGLPVPAVLAYINGYRNGATWVAEPDPTVLVQHAQTFVDPQAGYDIAAAMIAGGADVLFPVAGATSLGVLAAACESGVWGIGVDFDMWEQIPDVRSCTISSAEMRIASTVERAIVRWHQGMPAMQSGVYWNNSANDGVTWSPIRNIELTPELQAALHAAYAGMATGAIDPCLPTACDTE